MLFLCSLQPLCFCMARHDTLQFTCHFRIWRSGQNGAIQPFQLNTLLLTGRCLESKRSHEAVVEVLTFKSQLNAESWHIVSMHNFQFHGTFLLVLPMDFLPSSSLFVNAAGITSWGSLSPVLRDTVRAVLFQGGVGGSVGRDLSLHVCVCMYTPIQMPDNSIT